MRQPFDLSVNVEPDRCRIVLVGELDLHTAPDLASAVIEASLTAPSELEIDMQEVSFIDSTGLRALLVAAEEAASQGVALHLVPSANPNVTNLFEVTRLLDELPWRESAAERSD